jgi:hypothetical protein
MFSVQRQLQRTAMLTTDSSQRAGAVRLAVLLREQRLVIEKHNAGARVRPFLTSSPRLFHRTTRAII